MKEKKIFYGWWVVFACFILMVAAYGIINNCASLFFKPVSEDLGVSRTQFSMYYTIAAIALMIMAPFVGKIMKKFGTKKAMFVAALLGGGSYIGFSFASALPVFYILGAFGGIAMAMLTTIAVPIVLNKWFVEKKGLAIGFAMAGSGVGGLIFNPVTNYVIENYGWRNAYLVLGIIVLVLILPVILFIIGEGPESKGLKPYGYNEDASANVKGSSSNVTGPTAAQALKMPIFWLLGVAMLIYTVGNVGIQMHIPSYLTDISYTSAFAATMVTIYLAVAVPSKIINGVIFDKFGTKTGILLGGVIMSVCQITLLTAKSSVMVILFSILYGYGTCLLLVALPLIVSEVFGNRDYGTILGIFNIFMALGSAVGPIVSNSIYDSTGSYSTAWTLYIGFTVATVAIVLVGLSKRKKKVGNVSLEVK